MNPNKIIQKVMPLDGEVAAFDRDQAKYAARAQSHEVLRSEQLQNLQDVHAGKYVPPWKSIPFAGNINGNNMVIQALAMPGDTLGEVKTKMDEEMPVLRNYEVWRYPDNKLLMYSVDVFQIVFEEGQHVFCGSHAGTTSL